MSDQKIGKIEDRGDTVVVVKRKRKPVYEDMMPFRPYRGDTERLRSLAEYEQQSVAQILRDIIREGLENRGF